MVRITMTGKMMLGAEGLAVETLVSRLLAEGERNFVFDLRGLTHIDSTGLGRFIASYNFILQVDDASMRVAAGEGAVRSAFRVTKLDSVIPFFESAEMAERAGAL